jgi:hypothetical protein
MSGTRQRGRDFGNARKGELRWGARRITVAIVRGGALSSDARFPIVSAEDLSTSGVGARDGVRHRTKKTCPCPALADVDRPPERLGFRCLLAPGAVPVRASPVLPA